MMDIKPIGIPSAPADMQTTPLKKSESEPVTKDQFTQAEELVPGFVRNAESLFRAKSLHKGQKDYRLGSFFTSSDGTTFITYSAGAPAKKESEEKESRGYVAAVSSQGEILWESPVFDEGLSEAKVAPDGTIVARTKDHLQFLNPDGTQKCEVKLPEDVRGHWMDSSGNHYLTSGSSKEFLVIGADGTPKELPEAMKGVKGDEILQPSPDVLYVRDGGKICSFDLREGTKTSQMEYKDPEETKASFYRTIDHFDVDVKGTIRLWMNNNTVTTSRPYYDDFHSGLGFGRRWGGMPHPPLDDNFYQSTTFTDLSMETLGQDGKVRWKTEKLGSSPEYAQLPDGSVFYSNNAAEQVPNPDYEEKKRQDPSSYVPEKVSSGKYFVGRVGPQGLKSDDFMKVEGSVKMIMADREKGTIVVCHGDNRISEFNAKGELQRSRSLPADKKDFRPVKTAVSGRVIFKDPEGKQACALDMESGKVIPLTDTQKDYSFKVVSKEIEQMEEEIREEVGPGIEEFEEWINVGGVKIEKNE